MKYVMFEDEDGKKIPVLFPDCLVHAEVMMVMHRAITKSTKKYAQEVSAGFVSIDGTITTVGESESTGLKSKPSDAAYILLGDSVSRMPEDMVIDLMNKAMKEGN